MAIGMKDIRAVGRRIAREFHPERVILFGSHARGTANADSDIDVLVVAPFEGSGFRHSLKILNRLDSRLPLDLLTYRPEDVDRRYREGDPLIRDALDHGKVLYAKRDG
jgi:predicted nucleotidyltransferase